MTELTAERVMVAAIGDGCEGGVCGEKSYAGGRGDCRGREKGVTIVYHHWLVYEYTR